MQQARIEACRYVDYYLLQRPESADGVSFLPKVLHFVFSMGVEGALCLLSDGSAELLVLHSRPITS